MCPLKFHQDIDQLLMSCRIQSTCPSSYDRLVIIHLSISVNVSFLETFRPVRSSRSLSPEFVIAAVGHCTTHGSRGANHWSFRRSRHYASGASDVRPSRNSFHIEGSSFVTRPSSSGLVSALLTFVSPGSSSSPGCLPALVAAHTHVSGGHVPMTPQAPA